MSERHERMKEFAKACPIIKRPCSFDLLLGFGQIQFRRILGDNHNLLLSHSFIGRINVRLENPNKASF